MYMSYYVKMAAFTQAALTMLSSAFVIIKMVKAADIPGPTSLLN